MFATLNFTEYRYPQAKQQPGTDQTSSTSWLVIHNIKMHIAINRILLNYPEFGAFQSNCRSLLDLINFIQKYYNFAGLNFSEIL